MKIALKSTLLFYYYFGGGVRPRCWHFRGVSCFIMPHVGGLQFESNSLKKLSMTFNATEKQIRAK